MEHIAVFVISSASLTTLDLCSVLAFDNGIGCEEMVGLMACCVWFVWTDNRVGDDGMKMLCEAFTGNTTLTKVNIECLLWTVLLRMVKMIKVGEWQWTGNGIGDGGAIALSLVLESEETALASISLYGLLSLLSKPLIGGCVFTSHVL